MIRKGFLYALTGFIIAMNPVFSVYSQNSIRSGIPAKTSETDTLFRFLEQIGAGQLTKPDLKKPIIIAVVDDGFLLSHSLIHPYLYVNTREIPGNGIDDDHNAYIDDYSGFDAADNDADPALPPGRKSEFYHGTYITVLISSILEYCYGKDAWKYFRILPVKALSDNAGYTYLPDGYKGVAYAANFADIICCAWSGGTSKTEDKAIFASAISKGISIVVSAGNLNSKVASAPASFPGVISVTSVDNHFKKKHMANYGEYISVSAPGENIPGGSSKSDSALMIGENTSAAAAIATVVTAIIKATGNNFTNYEITSVLENSANPVDSLNPWYCGRLGAGVVNIKNAVALSKKKLVQDNGGKIRNVKGGIYLASGLSQNEWDIQPSGHYKGYTFSYKSLKNNAGKSSIELSTNIETKLIRTDSFNYPVVLKGNTVKVKFIENRSKRDFSGLLSFYANTIDSSILYCSGTQYLPESDSGVIEDGSLSENYASFSDCKWQLIVPEGKNITIDFTEFDIQENADQLQIYSGTSTLQESLMAQFSGKNLPPIITIPGNKVLVWFLCDGNTTSKGWKLKYRATDDKPGIIYRLSR